MAAYFDGNLVFEESGGSTADLTSISITLQNNTGSSDATAVTFSNFTLTAGSIVPKLASSSPTVTPFTLNDDVTATLDTPTGTVVYSFTGTAGDIASFNIETGGDQATWRLLDPYGRQVFGPEGVSSHFGVALTTTGTYLLTIEGATDAPDVVTVEFQSSLGGHTDPGSLTGTPIAIGTPVIGTINSPGDTADYVFSAAAGSRLYFDSLTDTPDITWSLTGPRGNEIDPRAFSDSDASNSNNPAEIDLPAGGTYRLHIEAAPGFTGDYAFNLLDLAAPAAVLATDGNQTTGTLDAGNNTVVYAFDSTAGTKLVFAASGSAIYDSTFRLLDPFGRLLVGPGSFGNTIFTTPVDGRYTLLLEGDIDQFAGADYQIALIPVFDPTPVPLTLGAETEGQVNVGGETTRYTFTLGAATNLILTSTTSDQNVVLTLTGPNGIVMVRNLNELQSPGNGSPVFPLAAGDYTIEITSHDPLAAPNYSFKLLDLASATPLTSGVAFSTSLTPDLAIDAPIYPAHARIRKSFGLMIRRLSETPSQ